MKKGMKAVAAMLGIVLVSGALTACKHHGSHGDQVGKLKEHVEETLKKIGTSEEQQAKISGVLEQIVADGKQQHSADGELKGKVVECLLQDTPNREWLHTTVDEKARALTGFAHRTVDRLVEISALLTPVQRAELKKKFAASHGGKE